jgi:GTP-binding protein
VADVPGLIKGASEGKGLGNIFLKHIERCEVIVHVLDLSGSDGRDPLQDYYDIRKELEFFNKDLAKKPEIIVGNKCDLLSDDELQIAKSRIEDKLGKKLILVSTVTGSGLDDLKYAIWDIIRESKKLFAGTLDLSKIEFVRPEPVRITMPDRIDVKIVRNGNDEFEVVSEYVKKYMEKYRMDAKYLLDDILEMLQKSGLDEKLRRAGAKDGDTVWLEGVEFTFKE